ncbi:hypothetical protein ARMSODRAFT_709080 [Armillaria solidipes]|uniref:Uncharacterized protein n=1 Tax=Armillaria solidipes TaxID=1076256 RepID=A0A2H3C3R5_9AGAR|nr:hypothetical protein ARMSODRAFT_709080 [Armillaria solidipes]
MMNASAKSRTCLQIERIVMISIFHAGVLPTILLWEEVRLEELTCMLAVVYS